MRPRKAGLKTLSRPGLIVSTIFCGRRRRLRVGAHLHHRVRLGVRRQEDDAVLEVDLAPLAVLHLPLVEDLVEELEDVGVRLLDLVEEDDGVGLAAHRLGQDAALAVADVARGGALQRRDGVRFLELRHVDRDHVPLAAVERLGEGDGGLGLADAGRPDEHEDGDRLARVGEARARGLDLLRDRREGVVLADDPLAEELVEVPHRLDLVGLHLARRECPSSPR